MKGLFALLAITVFTVGVSAATGFNPIIVGGICTALSFVPSGATGVVAFAGLNQEIWTDVLVQQFRRAEEASFLSEIPDESRHVTAMKNMNDVIHLVDVGVDPDVLINNTTYPIPTQAATDTDIPISLDKYQTKVTPISDDELETIAYDKIALYTSKHTKAVIRERGAKAAHALAPGSHAAATPVLKTTGANDGTGRKKLTKADLIKFKRAIDASGVDEEGRILVLCADHYNDLLEDDATKNLFAGQHQDEKTGRLNVMIAGFKIYWYNLTPYYNATSGNKASYGAVPGAGDWRASVFFLAQDMFKAAGRTKNYTKQPEPSTQQWEYNLRHNYIVLPRKQRAIGALISDAA